MKSLPYDRRDYASILEYLKSKAEYLSDGKWTDFSDGDIGVVMLKLMSYLADMNNYQIDKNLSELYLETATERESLLSLIKLVGYEPKNYKTARVWLDLSLKPGNSLPDGTMVPAFTRFTDRTRQLNFYNLEPFYWSENTASVKVYEGEYYFKNYNQDNVTKTSKLYLPTDKIDKETIKVTIAGDELLQVENVLTDISNTLCYSVHVDSLNQLYIQLPSYWQDLAGMGVNIHVDFLVTQGEVGNVGSHAITKIETKQTLSIPEDSIIVDNVLASTGGEDPESIEEIKEAAPRFASTMSTLVTLEDFQLAKHEVDGIADLLALDYNEDPTLQHPVDAYNVNLYVLPIDGDYIIDPDENLTEVGLNLKKFIDEHRLTSIIVHYKNVHIETPTIKVVAYINQYDLRADTLKNDIQRIILDSYDRSVFRIGEGIYSSKLSKQILDEIDYCNYIEVQLPDDSYEAEKMTFYKVDIDNIDVEIKEVGPNGRPIEE